MYKEKKLDDKLPNHPYAILGFGECLLVFSLAMDGLTGAIQDKMNLGHKTNPHYMMFNMNLWSCLWLFLGLKLYTKSIAKFLVIIYLFILKAVIITGECFEYIFFVQRYPIVMWYMLLLGLLASIGQVKKIS